jgi:hypothetical protein
MGADGEGVSGRESRGGEGRELKGGWEGGRRVGSGGDCGVRGGEVG